MVEGIEDSKLIKKSEKIELSNIIPKLFLQNYGVCTSSSGLFRSGITGREKEFKVRSSKLRLSERFFHYLREGLEQDKKIYDERRLKIADSDHAETLKTPLLLIFEQENFKSVTVKTPELYFETYKAIINSKIIDNKNFNVDTVISIVKSGRSGSHKNRQKKIQDILSSENLEPYDLVYIYFYLQSTHFFKNMYVFVENHNPIFNWLFQSDMTSQLLDYIFELQNQESFALVDRIIISKVKSSIHYIYNWEFENGVGLVEWFKAFMYYIKGQSLEVYLEKNAFLKFPLLADKFISCNISLGKISNMFSSIKGSQISSNPSDEPSTILKGGQQKTTTNASSIFPLRQITDFAEFEISFLTNKSHHETSKEKSRPPDGSYRKYSQILLGPETTSERRRSAPVGSFRKSFETNIDSSLKKDQASSKRKSLESKTATFLQPKTSFLKTEKRQKASANEGQVFLDYPKRFFQRNINPVLESAQVLEREYTPISGICRDLITNKDISIINVSSPENKYTSQYTLPMANEEIPVRRSSVFPKELIPSKETVASFARQTDNTQPISLYSMQKPGSSSFFEKRVSKNYPPLFKANTKDCVTQLVDLDNERSPMSLFLENVYLEEQNKFTIPDPRNNFGN